MNSVLLPSADLCSLVPHSARPVWHSWGRSVEETGGNKTKSTTARRRLFQQEDMANEETNEQFVQRLLSELSERYKGKWGFDFETERPLERTDSRFEFQAVSADSVPGFYRASNFASSLNCSPNNSDTENHHRTSVGTRTEEVTMMTEEEFGGATESHAARDKKRAASRSGGAVLRKVQQKSIQTPKRRRSEWEQTRVTDFLSTRKHLSVRSAPKKEGICEAPGDAVGCSAAEYSPHSRRRRSLVVFSSEVPTPKKCVVRQRRREGGGSSSVVSALFK
uniref:Cyclin-dependent kinase inhibitor domain-containing protein n=1 Tax=Globodera rostochiensis TaxID=31243 RepID=A0A914IDL4_GLORO